MMLMATGHLAMGRVWASVNRLIAITIAHARAICAIAIISGLVVSSIVGIIGRTGHVHALMDRQKPGFVVFPAADSHFSKATLRQNRAQSLAVATAAVTIAILPFFPLFSFFCFASSFFVYLSVSLLFSRSSVPLSRVSFGKPREKRLRTIYEELCAPFCSPRPLGNFDERSVALFDSWPITVEKYRMAESLWFFARQWGY